MCFRVAVRQVEAWLLADPGATASLLSIRRSLLPANPDSEADAKRTLVALAERSNRASVREALVPAPGSKRKVGPLYNATLSAFVANHWSPERAAGNSDSFRRCLNALAVLRGKWQQAQATST